MKLSIFNKLLADLNLKILSVFLLCSILVAVIFYFGYQQIFNSDTASDQENIQIIPVKRGDLVNSISINGSLAYPTKENLNFGSNGVLSEILVEPGDRVTKGQILAVLSDSDIAQLQKEVAQKQVDLNDSKDALALAMEPNSQVDLDIAKLNIENARESLRSVLAQADLEFVQAQQAVTNTIIQLSSAQENIKDYETNLKSDLSNAQMQVTNLKVLVDTSYEEWLEYSKGPIEEIENSETQINTIEKNITTIEKNITRALQDLKDAEENKNLKKTELDYKKRDLVNVEKLWENNLDSAKEILTEKEVEYKNVFLKWLGITEVDYKSNPEKLLSQWGINLEDVYDWRNHESELKLVGKGSLLSDKDATTFNELTVYNWIKFYPGSVEVSCDSIPSSTSNTNGKFCIRNEMDSAWDNLSAAQSDFDDKSFAKEDAVLNVNKAIQTAQINYNNSLETIVDVQESIDSFKESLVTEKESLTTEKTSLKDLQSLPDSNQIAKLRNVWRNYKAMLVVASNELEKLENFDSETEKTNLRYELRMLRVDLRENQKQLDDLSSTSGKFSSITSAQIDLAKSQLADVIESLAALNEVDQSQIELKEAEVKAKEALLNEALTALSLSTIKAPWDGLISSVSENLGKQVGLNSGIIEIIDTSSINFEGTIDEVDVLFMQIGRETIITLDSLPGQILSGKISQVASIATTQQGVVTYDISISLDSISGVELRGGLSAVAEIVLKESRNSLLVPIQALYGSVQQPTVKLVRNGEIVEVPVELGISDEFWTVVTKGLSDADQIAMEVKEASTTSMWGGRGGSQFRRAATTPSKPPATK